MFMRSALSADVADFAARHSTRGRSHGRLRARLGRSHDGSTDRSTNPANHRPVPRPRRPAGRDVSHGVGCEIRLSAGEPSSVGEAGGLAEFQVPGLAVGMAVGDEGLIVLIPQTLPLPAWYRQPDVSQNDQLQTFRTSCRRCCCRPTWSRNALRRRRPRI